MSGFHPKPACNRAASTLRCELQTGERSRAGDHKIAVLVTPPVRSASDLGARRAFFLCPRTAHRGKSAGLGKEMSEPQRSGASQGRMWQQLEVHHDSPETGQTFLGLYSSKASITPTTSGFTTGSVTDTQDQCAIIFVPTLHSKEGLPGFWRIMMNLELLLHSLLRCTALLRF